jgi:membrane protein DedA with SNARE-associated domain
LNGLVSAYVQHFTYAGLFLVLILCGLGLPVPEDLALLAGGFMVYRGTTAYPWTLLVALVGVIAGDNSLFFLGRRFGTGLLSYLQVGRPKSQRRIERLTEFMRRHGHLAIFYARFLAGARALVYVIAGSVGFDFNRFFIYDALGALISVPTVVTAGYLFGPQIQRAVGYIGGIERLLWMGIAGVVIYFASRALFTSRPALLDKGWRG